MPTADNPWRCCICGTTYVVPTLARLCVDRHERETAPKAKDPRDDGESSGGMAKPVERFDVERAYLPDRH
jgi:hypothetical protein